MCHNMPRRPNKAAWKWTLTHYNRPYLVSTKAFNEGICLLHASIHHHGNTHGQTAEDLLVLRLLGIADHVLDGLGRLWAQHDEAEGKACSFTWDFRWFCVKRTAKSISNKSSFLRLKNWSDRESGTSLESLRKQLHTSDSIILIQVGLQEVVNILPGCTQSGQTEAEGSTVTDNLLTRNMGTLFLFFFKLKAELKKKQWD